MCDKICLYLDESGNLGRGGRYFTIAAIETENSKPLNNVMKKAILKTKQKFTKYNNSVEIKASESSPVIKDYILRRIASKENINIRYIVSDKKHVKPALLENENLLYNYMLKFLIAPVARRPGLKKLVIVLDKRSIKVKSANSFEDYINIVLKYDMELEIEIVVDYVESHNSYSVQAADFVANAIYTKYEHEYDYYYDLLSSKMCKIDHFPYTKFSKD